jgi:large conductance mechanosensitive channel
LWGTFDEPTYSIETEESLMADAPKSPSSMIADPAKTALTLFEEFKNFAFKGNVVDLAVGVIIGGAFGKIIDSLVKHVIMPLISVILPGDKGYTEWVWTLRGKGIPIGQFLGEIINFLIIALVLYIFIVKFLGWLMKSKKAEQTAPPPLSKDQELLTEIRDLLKARV